MGWLDDLEAAGARATTETPRESAPAPVHQILVPVRNASASGDPGEVAIAYYIFEGGKITLTDEKGAPLGGPIAVPPHIEPQSVARCEAAKRRTDSDRFWRRLDYRRGSVF